LLDTVSDSSGFVSSLATASTSADAALTAAAAAAAAAASTTHYVPPPMEPVADWQIWAGFVAGMAPIVIATYEFGKRILIQRQCAVCTGSGLVAKTIRGERRLVKCVACGGFLPWVSWKLFLRDTTRMQRVGNGGALRLPRGQSAAMARGLPLYDVESATRASQEIAANAERGADDEEAYEQEEEEEESMAREEAQ
jgi:hypothetical protein